MKKRLLLYALFLMILLPAQAYSWSWTPLQFSVWEPVQLFPENYNVYGIRLNLVYGRNQNVTGLDMGGMNTVIQSQKGGQIGLINLSEECRGASAGVMNYTGSLSGGQLGLMNTAQNSVSGLQVAGLMNLSDRVKGLQVHCGILGNGAASVDGGQFVLLAGYNLADKLSGLQLAMFGFNYSAESARGAQVAMLYNYAKNMSGFQLGLVNVCETLSGVQIGLVNIIWQEKIFFLPLVNFSF